MHKISFVYAGLLATIIPGDEGYFANGRVASRYRAINDTLYPAGQHGPDNDQLFPYAVHTGDGSGVMIDPPDESLTQGDGRSPGQGWPHMPRTMGVNPALPFDAIFDDAPTPIPLVPAERDGWALRGPSGAPGRGYEPTRSPYLFPEGALQPFPIPEPASTPWTSRLMGEG